MNSPSSSPASSTRDLFLEALEKHAPVERAAFLDGACRGDAALRAAVDELLANHHDDSFLEDPALSLPTVITPASEQPGESIGRYKLLQQIGEGGFGSVWMAEQMEPVSRRVALKIIKLGMDTREVIARFEAERQALAMMDHPNIARVLDAGSTDRGRPFFVMELVKGMPITQYCDEAGLGTRERLALFGDVCAAINHAHQKGIIHRDIKPSNVMVTLYADKPVVKVIDFGIAKATQGKLTDKTLFTRFEQFIGTPVYMSPEQAALSAVDIDTRSDIYALGVLLYELLVGKPPFDGQSLASAGYEEMRRIIREVEPVKPSSRLSTIVGEERTQLAKAHRIEPEKLNKLVEPDLDWIVMKAIEKDRTRRYETANAFAQDIRRFLADEPVTATPPSAGYQFRKFARRNKAALRIAAAIAAVLVAATAVSTWQAFRATAAEKKTADTLAQVAAERDAKEVARKEAEDIATFLGDVFQSPDPTRDGREIKVVELLDNAAKKLETNLATQPAQRAKLQATLGRTYISLGLARQAIPLLEKSRDFYLVTFGPEHPDTLIAIGDLAGSYYEAGRRDEALKLQEEVLQLRRKVSGPEHPDTLKAMSNLAFSYSDAGRRDEALKMLEEVLPLCRKVLGPEHPGTLSSMTNLALSYYDAGRLDEALKIQEEVLTLSRKVLGPEHPGTLAAMSNLATSCSDAGRRDEALKLREEVLPLMRKVNGPEHPSTLSAMRNLAVSYAEASRKDEALKLLEEVLPLSRKVLGPEHPDTLMARNNLAATYYHAGRGDEALKMQEEVLPLYRKVKGPEHPDTLMAMTNLALSYRNAGRVPEALKMQEEVLTLTRKLLGPEHPDTLGAMTNLALSYGDAGRLPEAVNLQEESLALKRRVLPPNHPWFAVALGNMAGLYEETGRLDEAAKLRAELTALPAANGPAATLKMQEEVLAVTHKLLGPEHPDTLGAMQNLANSYAAAGRRDEALKMHEEGLALFRKVNGPEHPDTLGAMTNLALSYRNAGRVPEALKMQEEVLTLTRKLLGPEHPDTLGAMTNLALSYGDAGRLPEAVNLQEESLALKRRVLPPNHPWFAVALRSMADLYEKTGRKDEAAKLRAERAALKGGAENPAEPPPPAPAGSAIPAPTPPADAGHALKSLEAELETVRSAKGPEHADTIAAMTKLAAAYGADGSGRKAIKLGEEALALARRALPAGDPQIAATMRALITLYRSVDLGEDAAKLETDLKALPAPGSAPARK